MHPVGVGLVKLQDGGYKERTCSDDRKKLLPPLHSFFGYIGEAENEEREVNAPVLLQDVYCLQHLLDQHK